jgi:hypothetical protein
MNSLSFSSSFIINYEPIEWNLNSVFANKFAKIQRWPRNYDKLWEIMNRYILIFYPFANICLYSVKLKNIQFFSIQIQLVR